MADHTLPKVSSWCSLGSTVVYECDKKEGLKCSTPLSSPENPISLSIDGSFTSIPYDSFCCPWSQCPWSCSDAAEVEGHLAGDHLNYFPYSCCICKNRLPSLKQLRDHEALENHPQYAIRHNPRIDFEKIIRAEKERFRSRYFPTESSPEKQWGSPATSIPVQQGTGYSTSGFSPFLGFSSQFQSGGFFQPKLEGSGPIEIITLDGEAETPVKSENSFEQASSGDLAHDESTSTVDQYENPFENAFIRDYSEIVPWQGEETTARSKTTLNEVSNSYDANLIADNTIETPMERESRSRHSVTSNDELQNGVTNKAIEESGAVEPTSAANIEAKNRRNDENAHINLQEKCTSSSSMQNEEDNDSYIIGMFEIINDEKSIWDVMSQIEKGEKEEGQKRRKIVKVKPVSENFFEDPLNKQSRKTPKKCVVEPERQEEVDESIKKWFPSLNQTASNEDEPVHRSHVDLEHEEGQFQ